MSNYFIKHQCDGETLVTPCPGMSWNEALSCSWFATIWTTWKRQKDIYSLQRGAGQGGDKPLDNVRERETWSRLEYVAAGLSLVSCRAPCFLSTHWAGLIEGRGHACPAHCAAFICPASCALCKNPTWPCPRPYCLGSTACCMCCPCPREFAWNESCVCAFVV